MVGKMNYEGTNQTCGVQPVFESSCSKTSGNMTDRQLLPGHFQRPNHSISNDQNFQIR
jgi:hypothetical protein